MRLDRIKNNVDLAVLLVDECTKVITDILTSVESDEIINDFYNYESYQDVGSDIAYTIEKMKGDLL